MQDLQYFFHGSGDSEDVDVFFVVPELFSVKQDNKEVCDALSRNFGWNANIITIGQAGNSRVVTGVYKGTIDEVNNGLLKTYQYHDQKWDCPVTDVMVRDVHQKMIRVLRGIISHLSRTHLRDEVKKVLRSEFYQDKVEFVQSVSLSSFTEFGQGKGSLVDVRKFFAFQIIQALGLLHYPCVEVYTKQQAAEFYDKARPLLYRQYYIEKWVLDDLQDRFVQACYQLLDRRDTTVLQNGKLLRTPFGRLNVKTELYEPEL